jgi:hypothetical protein
MSSFDPFDPANRVLVGHIYKVVLPSGEKYIGVESEDGSMSWTEQVHGTWIHDMEIEDNLALTSEMLNYAFGDAAKVDNE